ncbi:hypothetical protein PSA5_28375, partial [Pseudomonas syringae pv. actinidiae]
RCLHRDCGVAGRQRVELSGDAPAWHEGRAQRPAGPACRWTGAADRGVGVDRVFGVQLCPGRLAQNQHGRTRCAGGGNAPFSL